MSKEFEEIVLKKLEKLDERTKNTDGIIENVILKKLEKLDDLEIELKDTKQGLKDLATKVEDSNQRLEKVEVEVKNTKQGLQNLAKDMNQRLGKVEVEVKDTGEVVMDIRQNFAKFDYELNMKIDTLFDANTVNQEKHTSFEEKIISLDEKTFNHDIRISNLEDKVLTA